MIPLLPFVAGIAVGAVAVSALRSDRTRQMLNETAARLRGIAAGHSAQESPSAAEQPAPPPPAARKRAPRKPKTTKAGA